MLTKLTESKLITFENKTLRRILRLVENDIWSIPTNKEFSELYSEDEKDPEDIVAITKSVRLRWTGHVYRRNGSSILKAEFTAASITCNFLWDEFASTLNFQVPAPSRSAASLTRLFYGEYFPQMPDVKLVSTFSRCSKISS